MVYNGNAEAPGIGKGQISRYLLQLIVSGRDIERKLLKSGRTDSAPSVLTVNKTREVLEQLCRKYDTGNDRSFLSPSALHKYMECKLKFYLAQVAGLK